MCITAWYTKQASILLAFITTREYEAVIFLLCIPSNTKKITLGDIAE